MEIGTQTKKPSLKFRIWFAIGSWITYGLMLYIVDNCSANVHYSSTSIVFQAVLFGIFFGVGFPFLNQQITGTQYKKLDSSIRPTLTGAEKIEIEGPAHLIHGVNRVGGRIYLTNQKMIFTSHENKIQNKQTDISYQNITKVEKRKTKLIHDNGIRIFTKEQKHFDFVVNERDVWLDEIRTRIK